jgi:murein DD-endopeptidase MepM/ murein hydrolase activator NlpD
MSKRNIFSFSLALAFFVYPLCNFSSALEVAVSPQEVFPGDAFAIKVTEMEFSKLPPASCLGKKYHFSPCGVRCLIAVGAVEIKTNPGVYPVNVRAGGKIKRVDIVVRPRSFPTMELTMPEEEIFLSPQNLARVKKEERRLRSVFQKVNHRIWEGNFLLPLNNEISSQYGTKRIFNKKRISTHRGIDIKGREGEEVRASNHGRVILAGELFFGGNTIILDHGLGIYSLYMHLSKVRVSPGEMVSKGDVVGLVGSSGRSSGPHLHFGIKIMNTSVNPLSLVGLDL